jgi:group I intron endonuclease
MVGTTKIVGIYVICVQRHNGESAYYVGQTVDFTERTKQHLRALRAGRHDNVHLQRCFNKYGEMAISFELIARVERDKQKLTEHEQNTLDLYANAFGSRAILNVMMECVSSHLGVKRRPESVEKLAKAIRGKKRTPEQNEANRLRSMGRHMSEETRKKISDALKQRPVADASRAALDKARTDPKRLENLRIAKAASNYSPSQETRDKIAQTLSGRTQDPELVERRISKLRGRKQTPTEIANRVASRLANAKK